MEMVGNTEALAAYVREINRYIRGINSAVSTQVEAAPTPAKMAEWMRWIVFRLDWEPFHEVHKTAHLLVSIDVQKRAARFDAEAQAWEKKWAAMGVVFVAVLPPSGMPQDAPLLPSIIGSGETVTSFIKWGVVGLAAFWLVSRK